MTQQLFDPALLFRLQLRPTRTQLKFGSANWRLPDEAALPALGQSVSGQNSLASFRMAVSDTALFVSAYVTGKRHKAWCRESMLDSSDGLHVWIDTRNSRDVHRATRFCHHLVFAPAGRGPKFEQPCCGWVPINRARENSKPPSDKSISLQAVVSAAGYELHAAIAWNGLTGFDRNDFPVIGFYMAVIDRELGWQSLGLAPPYPVAEDPSIWLELCV
jgi:hypothetical protein